MSDDAVEIDMKPLEKILRALKGNIPVARVGILGGSNQRAMGNPSGKTVAKPKALPMGAQPAHQAIGTSNAEIGMKHEFGMDGMPMRSFLRIPLIENFKDYLEEAGGMDKKVINEMIKTGTLVEFVKKMGIIAERVVLDAFHTGGFGKWPPSDMRNKKNHETLVETQQLRNSITSDVKSA